MIITWFGQACFKIQTEKTIVIIDPFDEKIGFSLPTCHADIILVTHSHYDHSNNAAFPDVKTVIQEPGEYALDNITVKGIQTFHDATQGRERGLNTMYKINLEGLTILHMGDFGESELRQETLKEIGKVDILMIPVGGTYTVDGVQAAEIARHIGAKIVIPMHYLIPELKIPLNDATLFLKNMGVSDVIPQKQLKVIEDDLMENNQKVIILSRVVSAE